MNVCVRFPRTKSHTQTHSRFHNYQRVLANDEFTSRSLRRIVNMSRAQCIAYEIESCAQASLSALHVDRIAICSRV